MIVPASGNRIPHIAAEIAPDSVQRDSYLASFQLVKQFARPIDNATHWYLKNRLVFSFFFYLKELWISLF